MDGRRTIQQALDELADDVMRINGVCGIGLGDRVIQVYVERDTAELREQIPLTSGHWMVRVIEVGELRAQPAEPE